MIEGTNPEVWNAVHALHKTRGIVVVTSPGHVSITGAITGLSGKGFTVAGVYDIPWTEAAQVFALNQEDTS